MKLALCNEVLRERPFAEQCRLAAAIGCTGLELAPFTLAEDPQALTEADGDRLRGVAAGHGLTIASLHWLLVAPPGLSLATPDVALDSLGWADEPLAANGGIQVNLDAGLSPFDGNYRAAMRRIEEFMQTLQAMPGVHDVTLRSSPVNADSSSTLSGKTLNADASAPAARFSLSLLFREARP